MRNSILYLGVFDFDKRPAAVQRVLPNAAMFTEIGYKVIFISSSTDKTKQGINNKYKYHSYDVYSFPAPDSIKTRLKYKISPYFIEGVIKRERPNCVIMYNYPAIAMYRIRKICKRYGIVAIADSTEWYASTGNILDKTVTAIDVFLRMRIIQWKMDALILTSSYLMNYYLKYNKPKLQLPTLIDYSDPKWENCKGYHHREEEIVISTIAVLSNRAKGKGKDELYDVVNCVNECIHEYDIPNLKLYIIGTSEESFQNLYLEENHNDSIVFLGRMPHEETLEIISKSDYFLFIREENRVNMAGFPTKYSEAIACGTPVITTNTSDLQCYLIENHNGFFIKLGEERLSAQLARIIKDSSEHLTELHSNCKKDKALDYHSFIEETKKFLYTCLNCNRNIEGGPCV